MSSRRPGEPWGLAALGGSSLDEDGGTGLPCTGVTGGTGNISGGPPTGGTDTSDIAPRLARMRLTAGKGVGRSVGFQERHRPVGARSRGLGGLFRIQDRNVQPVDPANLALR